MGCVSHSAPAGATLCVGAHHFASDCIDPSICNAAFAERHLLGGVGPAAAHFASGYASRPTTARLLRLEVASALFPRLDLSSGPRPVAKPCSALSSAPPTPPATAAYAKILGR
jgi:hypothetical protein